MVSATPQFRDTAARAASKVRSKVTKNSHHSYAWLFAPECENDIEPVIQEWLQNERNLEYVSREVAKPFKRDPSKNIVESYAIVWTDRSGTIKEPFPGKHVVIIGLEYVDENNGLPVFENIKSLGHGEFILLSGNDDLILSDKGGGISLLIILDMS